ncbi:DUF6356 family protein [Actibacterium sp. 188UL27-1]|uniref:DUF6356 family protein n=1 Tax=Actibacterium sp. 188UL27-1 TaxID=2786961 RepID=UPI00195C4DD3|nr:DUF6356 family protein [Actibacterium sp. 188UL27-1]MBM7066029.1 hypothetical protein [Actibacterium sp. 188UL27-1]
MPTDITKTKRPAVLAAFTDHPASIGESYWQHFGFALRFSGRLFVAGGAALIHAVVPALCETTASRCIRAMHDDLTRRQSTD